VVAEVVMMVVPPTGVVVMVVSLVVMMVVFPPGVVAVAVQSLGLGAPTEGCALPALEDRRPV
jgi:hypothetical protein